MIRISNVTNSGWKAAIKGMRNPLNSWDMSDSKFERNIFGDDLSNTIFGKNDLNLISKLTAAGSDHRKFLRMVTVTMDITAPLYWWKQFDQYKVSTTTNSCSTMHKIHSKPFEFTDFSIEKIFGSTSSLNPEIPEFTISIYDKPITNNPLQLMEIIVITLNECRKLYLETKDKKYWYQMIQLLPSSYNQTRTVHVNLETLLNIYNSRLNHKLDEWHELCHVIKHKCLLLNSGRELKLDLTNLKKDIEE